MIGGLFINAHRDLLGLTLLAVLCIIISPFYKETVNNTKQMITVPSINTVNTVKSQSPKTIVFLSDSFLPKTLAGSELSGYETIKYLRSKGHTITLFIKDYVVDEYDGFKMYKYNSNDPFCISQIQNADIVFFQMGDETINYKLIQTRVNPTYIFIHVVDNYKWLLQQKISFPISVIYNSQMTQNILPTIHDNMLMLPYVETDRFKPLRTYTIQNDVVTLINCNKNKGGQLFKDLAYSMPNVQFLGVKGGYSNQIIDESPPPNLTYIENQKDIRKVFKKAGILVMPSGNETWGRTAVEAMASGVPVIHSESAGLMECVGGAGIMCLRNDHDAWADAIKRILGDRAYREQLRQYGFKRVEEIEKEQLRGREELARKIENI